MKILDMRGQPCPIPVVNAKKALAEPSDEAHSAYSGRVSPPVPAAKGVVVLVDNMVAVQNLEKMAKGTGCAFSYEEDGSAFKVKIVKDKNSELADSQLPRTVDEPSELPATKKEGQRGPVVYISSDSMGRGAEDLGQLLAKGFIFSLTQLDPPPEAVIFLNSGVRLTTEGANTVPDLKALEEKGVGIYTCGTCAAYYKTNLAVGSIVDMMTITNLLASASKGTDASGIITI